MSQTSSCCGQGRCPGLRELWLPRRALGPGRLGSEQPRCTVPFPGHGGQRAGTAPPAPAPRRAPLPDTDASDPACPAQAGACCPRSCGRAMSGLRPPAGPGGGQGAGGAAPPLCAPRSPRPAPGPAVSCPPRCHSAAAARPAPRCLPPGGLPLLPSLPPSLPAGPAGRGGCEAYSLSARRGAPLGAPRLTAPRRPRRGRSPPALT